MTDTMTEQDMKRVQEWLGECWHEYGNFTYTLKDGHTIEVGGCIKCYTITNDLSRGYEFVKDKYGKDKHGYKANNRTFKSPADLMDCFRKLVDMKTWEDFYYWAAIKYLEEHRPVGANWGAEYTQWLFSPLPSGHWQLAKLLSEAIEEGVVK